MEKDFFPGIPGDGVIRERVLTGDEIKAAHEKERDRERSQREAAISARLKLVLNDDSAVITKIEPAVKQENI